MNKLKYLEDIRTIECGRRFVYDRGNGRKTAFLHFVDGMQIWDYCPELWKGWRLMHQFIGEKEVY